MCEESEYDSGPFCRHWYDPADCEICNGSHLEEAIGLLKEALPLIPPDAPLRWYKNDAVRNKIRKFIKKNKDEN